MDSSRRNARQRMLAHYADAAAQSLQAAENIRTAEESLEPELLFAHDGRVLADAKEVRERVNASGERHIRLRSQREAEARRRRAYLKAKELGLKKHLGGALLSRLSKELWVRPNQAEVSAAALRRRCR